MYQPRSWPPSSRVFGCTSSSSPPQRSTFGTTSPSVRRSQSWHACYSLDRCGTSTICPRPSLSGWYCQRWSANALIHAVEKLEAFGPQLGYPHTSAVQGFTGLRELRPRAGRSPWRALYRRVSDVFVLAAVGPEAQSDQRGFDRAARQAVARLAEIEEED